MPNDCENTLHVFGDPKDVKKAFAYMGTAKSPLDFNRVIPYPKEYAKKDAEFEKLGWDGFKAKYGADAKDGYNSGGYGWRIQNWGTKWNAYDVTRKDNGIHFTTAWGPCEPVISKIHEANPNVMLRYEYKEPGMCFGGRQTFNSAKDPKLRVVSVVGSVSVPGVPDEDLYWEGEDFHKQHPEYREQYAAEEAEENLTLEAEMASKKIEDKTTEAAEQPAATTKLLEAGDEGFAKAYEKYVEATKEDFKKVMEELLRLEASGDDEDMNWMKVSGVFLPLIAKAKQFGIKVELDDVVELIDTMAKAQGEQFLKAPRETLQTFLKEAEKNHNAAWNYEDLKFLPIYTATNHDHRRHNWYMGAPIDKAYATKLLSKVRANPFADSMYDLVREEILAAIAERDIQSKNIYVEVNGDYAPLLIAIRHNLLPPNWHALAGVLGFTRMVTKGRTTMPIDDEDFRFMDPTSGSFYTVKLSHFRQLVESYIDACEALPATTRDRADIDAVIHQLIVRRQISPSFATTVHAMADELMRRHLQNKIMDQVIKVVVDHMK